MEKRRQDSNLLRKCNSMQKQLGLLQTDIDSLRRRADDNFLQVYRLRLLVERAVTMALYSEYFIDNYVL